MPIEKSSNDAVTVSIIISSYNYARYLRATIDSALAQSYQNVEVIVVDDGSTDASVEIMNSFGTRIQSICKSNKGQASAFNIGFEVSRGSFICFMDSDDTLLPTTIERAVEVAQAGNTVKVHWPLLIINEHGKKTGNVMHRADLSAGDLKEVVVSRGPGGYNWPSTSGNIWSREFLGQVLPVPEDEFRIGPDVYLAALAPFFGLVRKLKNPGGCYRIHGNNNTYRKPILERVKQAVRLWDDCFDILDQWCGKQGFKADRKQWQKYSWWHQTDLAISEIKSHIPSGDKFILLDEGQWVTDEIEERKAIPLMEHEGRYWGPPEDSDTAIKELGRLHKTGASFIVFTAATFWWIDHYARFYEFLESSFDCSLKSEHLVIFDLNKRHVASAAKKL